MKRKILGMFLAGMCLTLTPAAVYAEAETAEEVVEETAAEEAETADGELSADLYDFQVKIGDVVYQFPMYYEEFAAQGWTLSKNDDPEMGLASNSYGFVTFYNGEDRVYADAVNLGINELPMKECLVGGISIDGSFDYDLTKTRIELAGGIVMGESNGDDLVAAYGDPSDTYEGDLYTKYTYEKDYYQEIAFYVYKDDNTLKQVELQNFTEPEGFDKGSVSTEIPEIVSAYAAPTELGEDLLDPRVEYCGDLYTLPAPVSAFLENGWEMQDVPEDAYVAGGSLEFIDMMKNNQSVHFSVYNYTGNATGIENCFVRDLDFASYDNEALSLKLSGGFTLGAKKADLIAAAEASGYLYSEDGEYLNIYRTADTKNDNRAQFWFDADEDPDTASSVGYLNEDLPE